MINSNSTLVIAAMKNTIDFFSIILDLCRGNNNITWTFEIAPLLQLVFDILDWSSVMPSYNAIPCITLVTKTDNNLLVLHSFPFHGI